MPPENCEMCAKHVRWEGELQDVIREDRVLLHRALAELTELDPYVGLKQVIQDYLESSPGKILDTPS